MKKLFKHYANIFGTYGILTPIVLISLSFVILLAMERNDVFSGLIEKNIGWFITIAVLAFLAVAGLCVLYVFKLVDPEINFVDLGLVVLSILTFAVLVLFCFNPGAGLIGILKWAVFGLMFLASIVGTIFRSKYSK